MTSTLTVVRPTAVRPAIAGPRNSNLGHVDEQAFSLPRSSGVWLSGQDGAGLGLQNANHVDGIDVGFVIRALFVGEYPFVASIGELINAGLYLGTCAHGGQFLSEIDGHHLADWFE